MPKVNQQPSENIGQLEKPKRGRKTKAVTQEPEAPKSRLQELKTIGDVITDPRFVIEVEAQIHNIEVQRNEVLPAGQRWKRSAYDELREMSVEPNPGEGYLAYLERRKGGSLTAPFVISKYIEILNQDSDLGARNRSFIDQIGSIAMNATLQHYRKIEIEQNKAAKLESK
jgi:hypothetical protein